MWETAQLIHGDARAQKRCTKHGCMGSFKIQNTHVLEQLGNGVNFVISPNYVNFSFKK